MTSPPQKRCVGCGLTEAECLQRGSFTPCCQICKDTDGRSHVHTSRQAMSTNACFFCKKFVRPDDPDRWEQVSGFVHGVKKDGLTLRESLNRVAHNECVRKAQAGVPPDQYNLFDD